MKLSDVCEINPRSQAISDDTLVSFVAMPDVSEDGKINTSVIRPYGEVKKGYTVFQEGDILFAKITPCMENGKGALASGLQNGIGVGSTEFHVLRPNTDLLDGMWLYYLTAWPAFRHEAEIHMTGSAGQKRVPKAFLERYQVDVPTLNEQKGQVSQLDRIRTVIEARQRQLLTLDTLIKARFVEMFGEQQATVKLSDVAEVTGGLTKNANRNKLPLRMPYLRVANVSFAKIDVTEMLDIGLTEDERTKTLLQYGDLLFVEGNGSPDQIGRVAVWHDEITPCVHQNHIIKTRFDKTKMLPAFAMYYFMSQEGRDQIKRKAVSTSGLYTLSVSKIADFSLPCPSIAEQMEFDLFTTQVDKSKVVVQRALERAQVLFDSLMQEYFG